MVMARTSTSGARSAMIKATASSEAVSVSIRKARGTWIRIAGRTGLRACPGERNSQLAGLDGDPPVLGAGSKTQVSRLWPPKGGQRPSLAVPQEVFIHRRYVTYKGQCLSRVERSP